MTPLALWAAIAVVALIATASWALIARDRGIYLTSGLSFVTYAWLSLTGGDTAMFVDGSPIYVRQATASLQWVALAMAVISVVVFAMRLMGAYPSVSNNAADSEAEQ